MPEHTVKSHADAWIDNNAQHKNHDKGNRLHLRGPGSGNARQSFIGFPKPFPHNPSLVVLEATLQMRVKDGWGGDRTVTVSRVKDTWKEHRITWANAPDVAPQNQATEHVVNADDGDLVEIDVTDIMGDINLGADWYGFRLELDDDVDRTFFASDSPHDQYHPRLYIHWTFAPYPPVDLKPGGGQVIGTAHPYLQWRFADRIQESDQGSSQVQISDSTDFSSPDYNSGKQPNTEHHWSLVGEYTLVEGNTYWWRVKTWDDQDQASGWSDPVHFTRISKGEITWVNPGPSNTVDDLTPLIQWLFTPEGCQERVRFRLLEVLPDKTTRERWEFPAHVYGQDHLTIPARDARKHKRPRPRIKSGRNYRAQLFIWDNEDRVGIANDKAYVFSQIDFVYERDNTPDPVDTFTATIPNIVSCAIQFTWTRASTPDYFSLSANGEEVLPRIMPTDVAVAGSPGTYSMLYFGADPGENYDYYMEAVEIIGDHNKHSPPLEVEDVATNPTGVWLVDDDYNEAVFFRGADAPDLTIGESGTTYQLVGQKPPVRITDAIRGYEGSWSGFLLDDEARLRLLGMKQRTKELRIIFSGHALNLPIYLEEIAISPTSDVPGREKYEVTLNFFQTDEFFEGDYDESY